MSVPIFLMKFAAKKVLGDLFTGSSRDRNEVNYDKTRDLDKFSEEKVELEELPENSFNKDDYQSRVDSLFIRGESMNLVDALKETSKLNVDLMSDVTNSVDEKMKVMSENIEKVKDVAETGSNLANLNLQTSLNNSSEKGGIIQGVSNVVNGIIKGVEGVLGGAISLVAEGVDAIKEKLEIGVTERDKTIAPGASEEVKEAVDKAIETAREDEVKKDNEVESYVSSTDASPFIAVQYLGKIKATDWLKNYYATYKVPTDQQINPESEAAAIREMSRLQQTNSGYFSAVDFNDEVISKMSDEELEDYWNEYSFNDKQIFNDVSDIEDKWEDKQKRDVKYFKLADTLADNESKLKFNSIVGEAYNYFYDNYKYSEGSIREVGKSFMKGKFPLFSPKKYKEDVTKLAEDIKERVVNDPDLMKIFSSKEIGLTKEDDPLKFLGNAMYYSSRGDYQKDLVSSIDSKGNHNLSLYEQVASQKEIVRGNAVVFDNKGNVVTDYDFLTDGVMSSKDASKYEVLTDSPEPTFDILGTKDVTFNANRENFQAVLEQVIQRNEAFSGQKIDVMKIMDYIDNNDGKLDDYLTLMTQAVSVGFSDVVSLVSNIVNDSSNNGVVPVSTDTD